MLVLSRKAGEEIRVGDDILVQVVRIGNGNVRLGITAPRDVEIVRTELETEPVPGLKRLGLPEGTQLRSPEG